MSIMLEQNGVYLLPERGGGQTYLICIKLSKERLFLAEYGYAITHTATGASPCLAYHMSVPRCTPS